MRNTTLNLTYQKLLTSRWVMFPLLLTLGFAGGLLCAGYFWSRSGYMFLPAEIVVKPPPPNATWCFPDFGFGGALRFRKELLTQMQKSHLSQYSDSMVNKSIRTSVANGENTFSLQLLHVDPAHFSVISTTKVGFSPNSNYTLITESGCYYLHPIPKRRSNDYDSLIQERWKQQAKL